HTLARRHRPSPLFPYTTLFRSPHGLRGLAGGELVRARSVRPLRLRLFGPSEPAPAAVPRRLRGQPSPQGLLARPAVVLHGGRPPDRKSTRLNSSHVAISYDVFC